VAVGSAVATGRGSGGGGGLSEKKSSDHYMKKERKTLKGKQPHVV
jgi:hypothetical protein